jgi:hypothetical protein
MTSFKQFLLEGGNIWKDTAPIKKEFVADILKSIKSSLPKQIKMTPHIGSAGFKSVSGDMDVFLDAQSVMDFFKVTDEKSAKAELKAFLKEKGYDVELSGRNVHVKVKTPDGFAQVDLMVIPDAEKVAPFHQHGLTGEYEDPSFKGGQLFILYASIAKALGLKFSPFEGKLMNRETGEVVADTKDAVAKVLLNKKATAKDLSNIKSILAALKDDPMRDEKLAQAKEDEKKGLLKLS